MRSIFSLGSFNCFAVKEPHTSEPTKMEVEATIFQLVSTIAVEK
jgi:hypothetical protein